MSAFNFDQAAAMLNQDLATLPLWVMRAIKAAHEEGRSSELDWRALEQAFLRGLMVRGGMLRFDICDSPPFESGGYAELRAMVNDFPDLKLGGFRLTDYDWKRISKLANLQQARTSLLDLRRGKPIQIGLPIQPKELMPARVLAEHIRELMQDEADWQELGSSPEELTLLAKAYAIREAKKRLQDAKKSSDYPGKVAQLKRFLADQGILPEEIDFFEEEDLQLKGFEMNSAKLALSQIRVKDPNLLSHFNPWRICSSLMRFRGALGVKAKDFKVLGDLTAKKLETDCVHMGSQSGPEGYRLGWLVLAGREFGELVEHAEIYLRHFFENRLALYQKGGKESDVAGLLVV